MSKEEQFSSNGSAASMPMTQDGGSEEWTTSSRSSKTPVEQVVELLAGGASDDENSNEEDYREDSDAAEDHGSASEPRGKDRDRDDGSVGEGEREVPADDEEGGLPQSIKGLAEKLGVEPAELYKLEFSTGDGESATLGQLKDSYQERAAAERETAERSAALDAREAGLATDIQQLALLDAMRVVPPDVRNKATQHLQQMAVQHYQEFLALSPDLQDEGARAAYEKEAVNLLADYGIAPAQFGVRTVGMHRLVRDALRWKKTVAKLTAPKAKEPPKPVKPNRAPPRSEHRAVAQAKRTGRHDDQIAAVASLISGG